MAALGKWIEGLKSDGRVSDAARLSLEARLAAVTYWLPLAARQLDGDIEKVHQLRVSTRRAIAAIKLYGEWLPRRRARLLTKLLKRIRRAAGAARDLDVLNERLQREFAARAEELLTIVAHRRGAVQPKIETVAERCLRNNRLHDKIGRTLRGIRPRGDSAKQHDANFGDWAALQLRQAAERFFAAMPNGASDLAALHRFRIAGKRLRYTMELLAPACGPELRDECYPVVEKLQERLGKINDSATGSAYFNQWTSELAAAEQQDLLRQLIDREQIRLQEAIDACRAWWTAERADALRLALGIPLAEERPAPDELLDPSLVN
jgi:CHAD domain-containing protein